MLNMLLQHLILFLCVSADPMGEEHHIRRTSGVPPLVVVVRVHDFISINYIIILYPGFMSLNIPKGFFLQGCCL